MKTSKILTIASLSALLATSIVATVGVFSPILPTEVLLGIAAVLGTVVLFISEYAVIRPVGTVSRRSKVNLLPATEAFTSARVALVPNAGTTVVQYL